MSKKTKFLKFICSPIGNALVIVALYAIIFGICLLIINTVGGEFGLIVLIAFGYFGWKALNRIQPDIFLIMPIGGWIIYAIVKGILSYIVGVFVAPFVIARKINAIIQEDIEILQENTVDDSIER